MAEFARPEMGMERLAEDSFHRLFSLAHIPLDENTAEYLTALNQQQVNSVRLLLRRVTGLESQSAVQDALRQLGIARLSHAQALAGLLHGEYTDVEATLVRQEVLRPADLAGDWAQLLFSLDIPSSSSVAEQVQQATGLSLSALLAHPESWNATMKLHVLLKVAVFREIPGLIDVLDSALLSQTAQSNQSSHGLPQITTEVASAPASASSGPLAVVSEVETIFSAHHAAVVLSGHSESVTCLCAVSDHLLISGSNDQSIRLWNLTTQTCLAVFLGHVGSVYCVDYCKFTDCIVSGGEDMTLRVWSLSTGQLLRTLTGHGEWVSCLACLSGNQVVSGSWDRTLRVWDTVTGTAVSILRGHVGWIECLTVLSHGAFVASGDSEGQILVWDMSLMRQVKSLNGHRGRVKCLCTLSADKIISGSYDGSNRLWDAYSGACLSIWTRGDRGYVFCLSVLNEGRRVISVQSRPDDRDRKLCVWNSETGTCLQTVTRGMVYCLAAMPDGRLVTGGGENTVVLWS